MLSSTECITWLVLFLTESVPVVTVNLLTIVIFIKNSNLCTRSLYLVIHLTVADLFVGVFSGSVAQIYSLMACNFVQIDYSSQVQSLLLAGSYFFPIVFPDKHRCDFFSAMSRHFLSTQTSCHQNMGLLLSNCCYLGFTWYCTSDSPITNLPDHNRPEVLFFVSILLLFVSLQCLRKTEKTYCDIVSNNFGIFSVVAAI